MLIVVFAGQRGHVHYVRIVILNQLALEFIQSSSFADGNECTRLITSGAQICGLSAIQSGNGPGTGS